MVGVPQVQFHENGNPVESFKGGTEERQGVFVLDGNVVKATVIYARAEQTVFFAHKEQTSSAASIQHSTVYYATPQEL